MQLHLQEHLELLADRDDHERERDPGQDSPELRLVVEGDHQRRQSDHEPEHHEARDDARPVEARERVPVADLLGDDRAAQAEVGKGPREADHHHRRRHQAEVRGREQPREDGRLGDAEDEQDACRDGAPLDPADDGLPQGAFRRRLRLFGRGVHDAPRSAFRAGGGWNQPRFLFRG